MTFRNDLKSIEGGPPPATVTEKTVKPSDLPEGSSDKPQESADKPEVKSTSLEQAPKEEPAVRTDLKQNSKLKNNEDRIAYIAFLGLSSEESPSEVMEVRIPEEFDEVYSEYNEMQKKNDYDLEKFKGKRVKRWTYKLKNYPESEEGSVKINLLIYKDKVIGGDICSVKLDGFMKGLKGNS